MSDKINELSKKTLGSYVTKAVARKVGGATLTAGYDRKLKDGRDEKGRKMSKYQLGGTSLAKDLVARDSAKRTKGIDRAMTKLTKEDVIDELSKKTLGSYIKAAKTDIKTSKRSTGINRAVDKLTKEEEEHMGDENQVQENELEQAVDQPEVGAHVADILAAAADDRPADAQQAFNDVLRDRVADFIANRREELSRTMFGDPKDPDDDQEELPLDDDEGAEDETAAPDDEVIGDEPAADEDDSVKEPE